MSLKVSPSFFRNNFIGMFGIIIIVATLIYAIDNEMKLRGAPIASPVTQIAPTLPPTPTLTLSELTFEVLNGSGIEGQAGKVADLLKERNVTKVTTANAEKYTYVKSIIKIKKEFASFTEEIEELLGTEFELDKTQELDNEVSANVQIIVGK